MTSRRMTALLLLLPLLGIVAGAQKTPSATPPMSKQTRMDLVRAMNAELVYIRSPFPMGKKGLTLKNGVITPRREELQQLMALWGPAAKPGDQVRISNIVIKDKSIRFEINGGPVKKKKWYQRIEVSGMGGTAPLSPSDADANPRGSFVDLQFDQYVPELTAPQLKALLRPVFDFDAKSAVEAYLETVPPKVKEAIKNHQALVGMNREMVIYAKGRPPKKIREKEGEVEYEEWIYGEPPQDVEFVRLVGDEVVQLKTMKVTGEKLVRTEKEVELNQEPSVAMQEEPAEKPVNAPTLRRPGEELPEPAPPKSLPAGGKAPPPMPPPSNPDPNATPAPQ